MPNKKITELPAAGAITGTELMEAVQGGINVQTTVAAIVATSGGGSAWTTTTAGIVQRSTQAQAQAIATRAGLGSSSGQDDARAPSELGLLDMLIQLFSTAVTWVAKMTFTAAPRFNSTTASQFLAVDSSKDLVSVAAATQAEMITGTDNTKVVTPLAVEAKRSVLSVSTSNGATGSTNIDCGLKQEIKIVYNTTVTGNITITKSNDTNLEYLDLSMPVTGASITVTFPSDTRMARWREAGFWNQSSKIFTISSTGTADLHEFSLKRVGSIFMLKYEGPYRA